MPYFKFNDFCGAVRSTSTRTTTSYIEDRVQQKKDGFSSRTTSKVKPNKFI
jgi:hypothetical protein